MPWPTASKSREQRTAAGKTEIGEIQLTLAQAGNEVLIEMSDDGAGLDLARIRAKAIERGLLDAGEEADDARIMGMIFQPGFSTAAKVTEVAGRGVGMDVVKNETANLGGRIEINSEAGQRRPFPHLPAADPGGDPGRADPCPAATSMPFRRRWSSRSAK